MNEKPKILITDDSEINRALLKEILGDGYDYLEAEDGAAAVELMRQRTDISLLLLDLMMPCLLYTSPSPRDGATSRMPSSA